MTDFENMYYNLMGHIADVEEFLSYGGDNQIIKDAQQMLCNILEESDERYTEEKEICMAL